MSTITLPNIRVGSDLQVRVRLKDGGVAIDWSTLQNIKACIYSDAQRALAGRCAFSIDEEDNTLLVCTYAANKPQYLGVNRIVISAKYMGETKTYDKPAFSFVRWTGDQAGEEITIDDPDVDVEISVEDVSSSILQEAVDAAFSAADRANEAAAAAEHMVDIHTGPEGKSAYEVAVEEGYTGTEEEWLASLKGDTGETPDISIGTVTTVAPGTPASASMTGTPEEPVLNLSIPQGVVGATPNFTVGTVTTGEPGSSVIVTITGTPEAPVLNLTIPQGMQGNTGSSVEFPYELVNNLTTNDATKGLSAAQGYVLDGKVSQLEAKVTDSEDVLDVEGTGDRVLSQGATNSSFISYQNGATISSSTNKSTNGIDISEYRGKTIQYLQNVYTTSSGSVGMAFYDSNDTFVSGVPCRFGGSTEGVEETTAVVPNNATYAKFTIFKDYADAFYVKALGDYHSVRLDDLETKVSEVETVLSESPVDIIDENNPQYTGRYWSAGGVLSTSANWRADTVNLINYRGKKITFCLGSINGDGQVVSSYNWIKKSDNSFVSLSDIMTQLPRTKNAMFIVPDDAVELQVSWDAVNLSSNNCVAYAQVDAGQNFYGNVDAISKTIGFTKSTPTYTLENGYWDIRNTPPSINTGTASAHTSPIALSKGDWLHFVISNGAGITAIMGAIVLVDSSGNSIASIIGGDGSKTDFSWRATQDCYISISYATGFTLIKSIEIYNSSVIEELFDEISEGGANPYSGKIWHCFGTSISNTSVEGKYPTYLEQMSGMQRVNFGRSGGCIGPSNSGSNYILNAIKGDSAIAQADVVTIEGFVNDWSQAVPLGNLTDSDGSVNFMGALNEALTYIQEHSNAQIFVITDNTGRLYNNIDIRRNVTRYGLTQNDYIEATIKVCNYRGIPVIDAGRKSMISQDTATLYLADQIHHTELGGYQFARVIWDEMKRFSPRALSLPE